MKSPFRFGSLESKIYTIFTILIFTTILIMQFVSFRFTLQTVRTAIHANNKIFMEQLINQIDSYIAGMELIAKAVAEDELILEILESPTSSSPHSLDRIQEKLAGYITVREDISDILIVGPDSLFISSDKNARMNPANPVFKKSWYKEAIRFPDQTIVTNSYVQNIFKGKYSWVVSLYRSINSSKDGRSLGVLLVDLKFNRIKQLCQSLASGEKGYNFILDSYGNYVFHPSQQLVYSDIRTEPLSQILGLIGNPEQSTLFTNQRYYMAQSSTQTGWQVINVSDESDMLSDWRYVQTTFTLIGLILFIVVGITTNRITIGITRPVKQLLRVMNTVETGDFKLVGQLKASDEIKELAREYDIMVGRIRELMAANEKEHELKRKSDLKALQAQINPHFLYNTLDSIIWMAEMDQSEEVVEMTSALSKLFRISISKGHELIPIRDELAHVQSYLTIQKMRYKDKFNYLIDVDPSLYDYSTLKITLQPIVENAIYHGIKNIDTQGMIRIIGWETNNTIFLEVMDNGKGMNKTKLDELVKCIETPLNENDYSNRHGMGFRNIHERIRIYFGTEYGLRCSSELNKGTSVVVSFPKFTEGTAP